jgi:hypothetical protein
VDPVLVQVVRGLIALVFAMAIVHKLRAPRDFLETVRGYALVPRTLAAWVAAPLLLGELAIAAGALLPAAQAQATALAIVLLVVYAASISINLARGRRYIDCGCSGPAARQPLSLWLVLRNLALAGAALATFMPESPRALGALDVFTIAAGVFGLYALYAATNLLLAYGPRTKAL